ncbi:kinesin-like protein KIF28P, partial [Biomphalaria glabrata]
MNGQSTAIRNPTNGEEKKFNFDYSYWSHDGFKEQPDGAIVPDTSQPNGKKFADQKKVYQDLGDGVLKNAWEGFNSTLFAYGQTGSGKSWSIVGYGINKGVVPLFCENIFKGIDEKKKSGDKTEFEVTFSMLEIYNEQVRDLLDPNGGNKRGGLRIRQHPKSGFY